MTRDYDKLCSEILQVDPKIRQVAIYDIWAEMIASKLQNGIEPYLPEKSSKDSANQAILRWQSRKNLKSWVGKAKYSMTEYEKIKRFTFYIDEDKLVLVTTEPDMDQTNLISKIQELS